MQCIIKIVQLEDLLKKVEGGVKKILQATDSIACDVKDTKDVVYKTAYEVKNTACDVTIIKDILVKQHLPIQTTG